MHGTGRWIRKVVALTVVMLAVAGCKEPLHTRVGERDANEMVATLYVAGIRADKVMRDEKTWSVEVEHDDVQRALQLLQEHGLPREQFANTGDLFKKEGLVSTPSEERIRYMYAVSQELSRTLSEIDGVITARVHLVMPANDPLASRVRPSSASVFIKHRANANLQALSPAIKNLVMRGIEGLDYENIALTFVPGEEPVRNEAAIAAAAPRSPDAMQAMVMVLAAIALLVVAVALGYLWSRARQRRGETGGPTKRGVAPARSSDRVGDGGAGWLPRFARPRHATGRTGDRSGTIDETSFSADASAVEKGV